MSKRVMWAVTTGQYSDYQVLGLCDGEERAKKAVAVLEQGNPGTYDGYTYEPFEVWDDEPEIAVELEAWCHVAADGSIPSANWITAGERERPGLREQFPRCAVSMRVSSGGNVALQVRGWDHERVRRSLSEYRAQLMTDDAMRAEILGRDNSRELAEVDR